MESQPQYPEFRNIPENFPHMSAVAWYAFLIMANYHPHMGRYIVEI